MTRNATALWSGDLHGGMGQLVTQSRILNHALYLFKSRFGVCFGTNPEELLAAAQAICFNMILASQLGIAGFTPKELDTRVGISMDSNSITKADLELKARIPGITDDQFQQIVSAAKAMSPVGNCFSCPQAVSASLIEL